jgi:hypothetical protein
MNIQDAFDNETQSNSGVLLNEDEEATLDDTLRMIVGDGSSLSAADAKDLAFMAFIAGRAYQTDRTVYRIEMSPAALSAFIEFLVEQ